MPESTKLEIAVVVASHRRPLRLRWLLNALELQTLPAERWQLIVCDDSDDPEIDALLAGHPLARQGTLRALSREPGAGTPARQRNAGWRAAQTPLIAFTDDDCRPAPEWLERLAGTAAAHPGAVIHGTTLPDPDEEALVHRAAHVRTLHVDPPSTYAPTCNIAYPRELLNRLDGFDERLRRPGGEDTDLAMRARAAGADEVGEPRAVVWHAVRVLSLRGAVADAWRWRDLPLAVARHPQLRDGLAGRVFWRGSHAFLPLALAGLAASPRRPALALVALPWAVSALPARGTHLRGRLRAVSELPGRAVVEAAEMAALAYGSARARTLML